MARRANKEGPHPVDMHVGARVKLRRMILGISQEKLAEKTAVTFQQIQKNERGTNRLSASRLYEISQALGVPVSHFFEGLDESAPAPENPVLTNKLAMEAARLVYGMDAIGASHLVMALRRLTQATASTDIEKVA